MDEIRFLQRQAEECRRAAQEAAGAREAQGLTQLARHYEREARRLSLKTAARRADNVVPLAPNLVRS
jgi:hypothetical protein